MTSAINDVLFAVSGSLALSTLAKATLAAALGLTASTIARRARAAVRHSMLAVTFGVLLALPAVSALAPPLHVVLRGGQTRNTALPSPIAMQQPAPAAAQPTRISVADILLAAWGVGAAFFLAPVVFGLWQVRSLRRSGLPWIEGERLVQLGVALRLHEGLSGPMTCGIVRPAVLLPADAPSWDHADLDRAIVHELEHVRRGDWAVHCVARTVCALYWFHPLVWMAWRRLELEAERACDDAVLARSEATAYADQLLSIARRVSAEAKSPLLAMASRADLGARVSAVLDGGLRRGRAGARCVTTSAAVALALLTAISPLRIVAAPQQENDAPRATLRADTNLVLTDVLVKYPNGNTIKGLTADDFALTENGAPQRIALFEAHDAEGGYYVLGYYAAGTREDGDFRKIVVTVKNASTAKVEFRNGYYVKRPPEVPVPRSTVVAPVPGLVMPKLLYKKEPEYSEEARKAKYQGTVVLYAEVDPSGRATNIKVTRALGLGLDEKAIEAVQEWRFKPGEKDGKAVTVSVTLMVNFRLP